MRAFVLAMVAMVGIAVIAAVGLDRVEMSAEQVNKSNSVRLN